MQFKTLNVNGVNVFYREAGTPGALRLVLLHGFWVSIEQVKRSAPALP
jgi:pimeloyl-ACP methyl ester carboxylesterase